jgi:hypothetical protein
MKYQNFITQVKQQPTVHNWVKDIIDKLDDHDVVDVLGDLELLQSIFRVKLNDIKNQYK